MHQIYLPEVVKNIDFDACLFYIMSMKRPCGESFRGTVPWPKPIKEGKEMAKVCEICGGKIQKGGGVSSHGQMICKACMDEIYEDSNRKNKHTSKKRKKIAKRPPGESV